jgi:hypothetical protein
MSIHCIELSLTTFQAKSFHSLCADNGVQAFGIPFVSRKELVRIPLTSSSITSGDPLDLCRQTQHTLS